MEGSAGQFAPDSALTREQMAVMLVRASGLASQAQSLGESEIIDGLSYTDASQISGWARDYAAVATREGLLQGSGGSLNPQRTSTRAEAAAVIERLMKRQGKR